MAREHRIHFDNGEGKPWCGIKGWSCLSTDWKQVECKYCLKFKNKRLKREGKNDKK